MMHEMVEALVTIIGFFVTVAIIALLVSPKATTTGVIQAGASGVGNILGVAESPVTGANITYDLQYPAGAASGFTGSMMLEPLQLAA